MSDSAREPQKFRKKPVEVEAFQWTGDAAACELNLRLGYNWGRADAHDVAWEHDDDQELVIWNGAEKLWLPVPIGHWIIRGIKGEFYPCAPDIFDATYEAVA